MTRYAVVVRDDHSTATVTIEIESDTPVGARIDALNRVFREMGWHKTSTGILDVKEVDE